MTLYELHQAVKKGDLHRVSKLLSAPRSNIDVNRRDRKGWTPLMYAVSAPEANVKLLRTLLHHGASIDQSDIVSFAIGIGDPQKIAVLIEAGADIRYQREHGYDALPDAVHGRDVLHDPHLIELLHLLIANGVSLTGMSTYGESAVRVLSRIGRFDAVQVLLKAGANANDLNLTPLIEAVSFGSLTDVEAVIKSGVDLEERDFWERTAWLIAIQIGNIPPVLAIKQSVFSVSASFAATSSPCAHRSRLPKLDHHRSRHGCAQRRRSGLHRGLRT